MRVPVVKLLGAFFLLPVFLLPEVSLRRRSVVIWRLVQCEGLRGSPPASIRAGLIGQSPGASMRVPVVKLLGAFFLLPVFLLPEVSLRRRSVVIWRLVQCEGLRGSPPASIRAGLIGQSPGAFFATQRDSTSLNGAAPSLTPVLLAGTQPGHGLNSTRSILDSLADFLAYFAFSCAPSGITPVSR